MRLGRSRQRVTVSSPERVPAEKNALTASGSRIRRQDADGMRRLIQPWQSRAFAYYDLLGEIKYASQFYARGLSQLRLYPAEKNDAGELVETTNADAIAALERIQDPGGGRSGLLAAYGRLMFLTGEAELFVSKDKDTDEEQWEMLSTDELRMTGPGTYARYKAPSLLAEEYREPSDEDWEVVDDGDAIAYRLWQRHPRYSALADSTMQGVLDLCEELVLLTQSVRARARSRLAGSGILFIATEFSPSPLEPVGDEDPQEDIFLNDLTEAMTAPIADEGAASAVVPLIVRGSIEAIDKGVKHLQIVDPTQLYPETGLRYECIKRIAIGLDMPPEILMGLQDSNHWTAWQIDEQTWKGHLQPKAQQLVDDLTSAYYRPALKEAGLQDYEKYSIAYDATAIINHPDRTRDAKDLYDKRAIGKKALRTASGFDEEDAPDKNELAEMVGIAVRDGGLAWFGTPTIRGGNIETAPGEVEAPVPGNGQPDAGATTGADVEPGPPPAADAPTDETVIGAGNGHGHAQTVARILGAADLALARSREAAGNRLRSLAKRDPEALALIDGVRPSGIAAALGREMAQKVRAPGEAELVAGAHELIVDALRVWGIEGDLAAKVAAQVERHAARTLYDPAPAPLPPQFENYVSGLVAASTVAAARK
jgi:hypothetical protein